MKRIALIVIAIVLLIPVYSQVKGKGVLGGNFNFDYSKYGQDEFLYLGFLPSIGLMISENVSIGTTIGISYLKEYDHNLYAPPYEYEQTRFLVSPYVRIQKSITEKIRFYTEPSIGKYFILDSKSQQNNFLVGLNFGFIYFINGKLSVETSIAGINYSHIESSEQVTVDYIFKNFRLGLRHYF